MIGAADHAAQEVRTSKSVRWANPFLKAFEKTPVPGFDHTSCAGWDSGILRGRYSWS